MILDRQGDVTPAALEVMRRTRGPHLREIMLAVIRHLHELVRDVRLTKDEFRQAIAPLNEIGRQTTDSHNEAVLMAGSLGISSLVCLLNNSDNGATETSQSLLGPF
ncbi:MAG: dioxygenase [Acetobacteraceae bacterium]